MAISWSKHRRLLYVNNRKASAFIAEAFCFLKGIFHQGLFGKSIQETFANKGIGTCLIKKLLEWARKQEHIEKISLEVFSNNERAIHLYTKLGFKKEGRRHTHVKFGPNE